jgi:xanthine dehydrogenase molybdopterin-binding subunit B
MGIDSYPARISFLREGNMGDYIKDLAAGTASRQAQINKARGLHADVNKELGHIYQNYHKGFTNCGNAKHIAECYQAHVGYDPDLTAMISAKSKKEQYYYLKRYLDKYPECKVDGGGNRTFRGGGGFGK